MRKVVDFGLFARTVSGVGAAVNGAVDKATYLGLLKREYPPEDGWEIVTSQFGGTTAEGFIVFVLLQKVVYA